MSLINKEVSEFSVQAFQDNAFKTVTKADILGKWSVFFFYPADFTFVCPTELEDLAEKYEDFKSIGCEIYSVSVRHPLSSTRRGTMPRRPDTENQVPHARRSHPRAGPGFRRV